jgi:hypothetical protein
MVRASLVVLEPALRHWSRLRHGRESSGREQVSQQPTVGIEGMEATQAMAKRCKA